MRLAPHLAPTLLLLATACGSSADPAPTPGPDAGAAPPAADAAVWGFPLVVTQRTMSKLAAIVGTNALYNQSSLASAALRLIVSPNQDTLYSVAVADLRAEPWVLTVPDVADRYWTYQLLDAYTTSFHYLGTRATSGKGGRFALVPPGFAGTLPAGIERIDAPTPIVFVLGRYLVKSADDAKTVATLDRRFEPLSKVAGTAAPEPPPALEPAVGGAFETGANGGAFFDELGDALALDPPAAPEDRAALDRFAALGIGPGKHPYEAADASGKAALDQAVKDALARIDAAVDASKTTSNGWVVHLDIATGAKDPLLRAAVARFAWGANVPEEAVYAASTGDSKGTPYDGKGAYRLRFDGKALPPVDPKHGFWSVTLYGPDRFFVDNPEHRFAIGDRSPGLAFEPDGSLVVYVQRDAPKGHEANWLPSPDGPFQLMLRLYLPQESVLGGSYVYPVVERAN